MNLGDGLLFELENGKPRLILLSHGVEKYPAKLSIRPRAANILSSRQPSCVEDAQGEERPPRLLAGRNREARCKVGGAAPSSTSNTTTTTTEGRSTTLTSSKKHHKEGGVKAVAKVKSNKHKLNNTDGPPRADEKAGQPQNTGDPGGGKGGLKAQLDSVVCLTSEQLQQILNTVQTPSRGPEAQGGYIDPKSASSVNEGGEVKDEEAVQERGTHLTRNSQEKDIRMSGGLFSWLEDRQSDSRAAVDARKAQWRRELDEQVAQKQQRSAPGRLQAEEYAESVLSVQSSVSHREQPAAIRSSLRLGEITPMEEVLSVERKDEQRRRWLEELDRQREETTERRKQEKLLQSQTEDHERWATHFDSLQRRPLIQAAAPSAPPPLQLCSSERGEWEPTSSLSLVWEAASSCGAESVVGASVDSTSGYPTRTSYLRTMTSLLDPAQIEERERRRLKQLEQQRAIEAQMEERKKQREQEEAKRRQEEAEEERRVALEREMLQSQYELEMLKKRQKGQSNNHTEQPEKGRTESSQQETPQSSIVTRQVEGLEDPNSSTSSYRDTAVQTEAVLTLRADKVQTADVAVRYHPPPSQSAAPPNSRSRAVRTGKENICMPAGDDPYELFGRTERSRRDKRRPEWNTQRPSRRFVPASERYPAALQKDRQESRLKRQAKLIALQERTCLSRTDPSPAQHEEPRLCTSRQQSRTSPRKVETGCRGHRSSTAISADRGRSPPVPAVKHRVQSQQASTTPPVLEFVPYVRTDEVFNLDPLEPANTPPPQTQSGAPPQSSAPSHRDPLLHPELLRNAQTQRQQEILRGLAQLRQGLLQKQRELETDLNPLLNRHDNEQRLPSTTHRM
ncbi:coiled-coil domain-containing protein 66 isoform X2 [Leuresthes tenuis]|uniref:coiled-coil domain-containing protein 66 isoform X2 n=1 Tax=Leuresthes tenuis TaxID=355514 RepID=UPI003B512182